MDDLVKRLRGWARDIREGSTATWAMDQDLKEAAARIEELEAKLDNAWDEAIDAASAYMERQYGIKALSHPVDRGRIINELKGTKQ